jgi:hypothetical protein
MQSAVVGLLMFVSSALAGPTTYDGRHDISTINLTVVYFVPNDREPLPDWKDRVDYHLRRVVAFHERELDGVSKIKLNLHDDPLVSKLPTAHFRTGDQDVTFFRTMDDVRALLSWDPNKEDGFPVLLVLSDINWRELDDFRRTRIVEGKEIHEGSIGSDGRHFPGAESGGARATYVADPGFGMGLVSGDGWRVPYSGGSDCVVYHEGLGHTIGLPHPEPVDNSVMGTAQYEFWINEAVLNKTQKEKLGWSAPTEPIDRSGDLFTHFRAMHTPIVPVARQPVSLKLSWPKDAKVKELKVQVQRSLQGKWETVFEDSMCDAYDHVPLGAWEEASPVSYRVDAKLEDGTTAEIWGYFQLKESIN